MSRSEQIEDKIGKIQGALLSAHHSHSSGFIAEQIKELTNLKITYDEYQEYYETALNIRQDILEKLKRLLQHQKPTLEEIKMVATDGRISCRRTKGVNPYYYEV